MRNNMISLVFVILIALVALYIVLPVPHPAWLERSQSGNPDDPREMLDLKLGLDLRGGTQVLLEADLSEGQTLPDGAMSAAKSIVDKRVNDIGVSETNVQAQGEERIIVELPGVRDPDQAVETLRATGQLEFIDPAGATLAKDMIINTTNHPEAIQRAQAGGAVDPASIPYADRVFTTAMTGDVLSGAVATPDQYGQWQINFTLTGEGSTAFFNYTSSHIGQPMAIVLDGRVLSAPTINAAINDNGVITGQFTQEEAESLAVQMRYGSLPVPLKVADIRTIGASLGQDSVNRSVRAAIIGLFAVVIYMVVLYRLPGILAAAALLCYIIFNLAIYKLIPVTLTLPGIAGFILSIGMAVDANILIFERLKEELRGGRSIRLAVEAGFERAWPAIWDSNISSLITCAVLYWFGNTFGASTVKGFAITLAIGVLLSMFSAIVVTRTFMRTLLASSGQKLLESRNLLTY